MVRILRPLTHNEGECKARLRVIQPSDSVSAQLSAVGGFFSGHPLITDLHLQLLWEPLWMKDSLAEDPPAEDCLLKIQSIGGIDSGDIAGR